jgi:hypothetical protein
MLPEKFRDQHNLYLDSWMRAEEVLKIAERIKNETFIPSIKELRYASRRVVQAHVDFASGKATDEDIRVHLTEAIENCRKARHDAIDSAINFVHEQLDAVCQSVGLAIISQAFPRYTQLRGKIKAVDARIVSSRKDRHALDDEYETIKRDHLTEVVDLYHELECSQDVIKSIQRKERNSLLIGGALLGLIIGSLVVIADKRGYFDWAAIESVQPAAQAAASTP